MGKKIQMFIGDFCEMVYYHCLYLLISDWQVSD